MKKFPLILAGAAAGLVLLAATAASAAPGMAAGLNKADVANESLVIQVQRRGVRVVGRPGGGRVVRGGRGGRGIGGAGAAAIGLGILGAAIAAGAAQSAQPVYQGECWIERRPVHDGWGNFMGYRRIRVCN